MSRRGITAIISLLALLSVSACAETIDLRDEPAAEAGATADDTVDPEQPLPVDGSLAELLPVILSSWRGLDQRVIDGNATDSMARIEAAWSAAEPLVRADHPSALFGMQQAVDLARSAVDRRRPADASKGYRLAIELSDDILTG